MNRINATTARKEFSETLNRVAYAGERTILERNGKGIAALVSMEDLELLELLEDQMDLEAAREAMRSPTRSLEEVKTALGL